MKIKVCMGSNCTLLGAMNILDQIEELENIIDLDPDHYTNEKLEIEALSCLNYCKKNNENVSPVVIIDGDIMFNATSQTVMEKIMNVLRK